jgi:23S rRNA pseudouridine1911/1915/1917 synthase
MSNPASQQLITYTLNNKTRLDAYLAQYPDIELSRSLAAKLIDEGLVKVNDQTVKASYKLQTDDQIMVNLPAVQELDIAAENIPLNIVYEDHDLIVLNKAAGMIVHPAGNIVTGTLVNALMYHCQDQLSSINNVKRPGIVHRLDKDTTGLMIVCKNDFTHTKIAAELAEKKIKRRYQALVLDNITNESGSIIKAIGRDPKDRKRMKTFSSTLEGQSKFAKTNWQMIKRFEYLKQKFCLLECKLDTGRTHQIRVHMQYFKHPIIGDPVYGPRKSYLKAVRPLLHSYSLEFTHPRTSELMKFEIPLADDFQACLDKMSVVK